MSKRGYLPVVCNLLIKILNIALVLMPLAFPHLPQFEGKAMGARMIMYPLAGIIVPLIWYFATERKRYPHLIDIIFVLPFVVDSGGNALNFYNTTDNFDRFAHLFNWLALTIAMGSAVSVLNLNRKIIFSLVVGFGATTHVLWEISEFVVMKMGASGLRLTYNDTMEDLILSLLGSVIGAILVITVFWKARLR